VSLEPGLSATVHHVVTDADTAAAMGSGDVEVLATPRVLALCEQASVEAIATSLEATHTSVGMKVQLDHINPTAVGSEVWAEAHLEKSEGRRLTFTVSAHDDRGLVAVGRITRVVVERARFLERTHGVATT
jgi:predicted thioesterase